MVGGPGRSVGGQVAGGLNNYVAVREDTPVQLGALLEEAGQFGVLFDAFPDHLPGG
jgi:hypothetical protein